MADGRQVRPLGMQVAEAPGRQVLLPIHDPGRGDQEEVPLLLRRAFDVRVGKGPRRRRGLLRLRAERPADRQRDGIHRQGFRQARVQAREERPVPAGFLLRVPWDRAQAHKAEDARAQRQGGEEPQDRPGKILQDPSVPFPQGPEGTGREIGEEIQRNAQDDA